MTEPVTLEDAYGQYEYDASKFPGLMAGAVSTVATEARDLAERLAAIDALRQALNNAAAEAGEDLVIPDVVTELLSESDPMWLRLVAAIRQGPAEAADGLGNAARIPACHVPTDAEADAYAEERTQAAATAAVAVLSLVHHDVRDVSLEEVLAEADPVVVCRSLAGLLLAEVKRHGDDAGAWLAQVGALWGSET